MGFALDAGFAVAAATKGTHDLVSVGPPHPGQPVVQSGGIRIPLIDFQFLDSQLRSPGDLQVGTAVQTRIIQHLHRHRERAPPTPACSPRVDGR